MKRWLSKNWLSVISLLAIPLITIAFQQWIENEKKAQTDFELALRIASEDKNYGQQAKDWAQKQIQSYTKTNATGLQSIPLDLRVKLCLKPRDELLKQPGISNFESLPDISELEDIENGTLKPGAVERFKAAGWIKGQMFDEYKIVTQLNQLISEVKAGCEAIQKID